MVATEYARAPLIGGSWSRPIALELVLRDGVVMQHADRLVADHVAIRAAIASDDHDGPALERLEVASSARRSGDPAETSEDSAALRSAIEQDPATRLLVRPSPVCSVIAITK